MTKMRWRRVQLLDESWQLEVRDPTFKAADNAAEYPTDGWRPLACVWNWENRLETDRPWRAQILSQGVPSNRDYTTLGRAKRFTGQRVRRHFSGEV